jgi:hypothetical protein
VKSHHEKGGHPTDWFSESPVIPDAHWSRFSPELTVCLISKISGAKGGVCNTCVIAEAHVLKP